MIDDQRDRLLSTAIGACAATLFSLESRTVTDPDLWGHVRFGQLVADLGTVPRVETFAYTSGPNPWINHEWLVELTSVGLYDLGGPFALEGLKLSLATVVFGVALWHMRRRGVGILGAVVLVQRVVASSNIPSARRLRRQGPSRSRTMHWLGIFSRQETSSRWRHRTTRSAKKPLSSRTVISSTSVCWSQLTRSASHSSSPSAGPGRALHVRTG